MSEKLDAIANSKQFAFAENIDIKLTYFATQLWANPRYESNRNRVVLIWVFGTPLPLEHNAEH